MANIQLTLSLLPLVGVVLAVSALYQPSHYSSIDDTRSVAFLKRTTRRSSIPVAARSGSGWMRKGSNHSEMWGRHGRTTSRPCVPAGGPAAGHTRAPPPQIRHPHRALSTKWRALWTFRWPEPSLEFRVPDPWRPPSSSTAGISTAASTTPPPAPSWTSASTSPTPARSFITASSSTCRRATHTSSASPSAAPLSASPPPTPAPTLPSEAQSHTPPRRQDLRHRPLQPGSRVPPPLHH